MVVPQPPDELKLIRPYIQRGNQMAKVDPVITYYCYYWAVRQALEKGLHTASPECTTFVSNLMEDLETRKDALKGDDRLDDDMAARAYVENFAQRIFDNGSKAVEGGTATAKTPDTLMAAVTFLELTKIFAEEPEEEVAKKIKYAKFHAARILKALKDGGDPNPPPPQLEERAPSPPPRPTLEEVPDEEFSQGPGNVSLHDESTPVDLSSPYQPSSFLPAPPPRPLDSVSPQELPDAPTHGGYFPPVPTIHEPSSPGLSPVTMGPANTVFPDIAHENTYRFPSPPPPTLPSAPPFQPVPQQPPYSPPPQLPYAPPPPPQQPPYQPTHSAPPPQPVYHQQQINTHIPPPAPARPQLREQDISQAQKYAKWAISALDYEDVDNAILQLRNALATLGAS